MFVVKRIGLVVVVVDIEDGVGEGWGDDVDFVLDDGKENMFYFNKLNILYVFGYFWDDIFLYLFLKIFLYR